MVEVVIDSVRVSLTNQQRIVVLREVNTERYLPIWIGPYEAEAITIALQEIEVARPQTHDLLKNILKNLDATLVRVEVLALREDVFYGNLVVEANGATINIDSRPSDALALAVRMHVPILIAREVMDTAGVIPEQNIEANEAESSPDAPNSKGPEGEGEDRLSIFEDFLSNLNMDDLSKSSGEDDEEPDEGGTEPEK
jgi:bifunctional DNase/RNase